MDLFINDLMIMLGISDLNSLTALGVVIIAFVSLIFLFKKIL